MKEIFEKIRFVEKLHAAGLLSNQQGTELLNIALQNFNIVKNQESGNAQNIDITGFFKDEARRNLKNFFENNHKLGEKFDAKTFINLIENIEKSAVSTHEQKKNFEQNLISSNDAAKEKLTSNAEAQTQPNQAVGKIYTREEIGKMSLDEYEKNEPEIMAQLEKGLIA